VTVIVGAIAIFGWVVALPVLAWQRRDIMSFQRPLWAGYGHRSTQLKRAAISYAAFGWPELVTAFAWRRSQTRAALVAQRENFRDEREGRYTVNGAP
jgi:hypothetical protein